MLRKEEELCLRRRTVFKFKEELCLRLWACELALLFFGLWVFCGSRSFSLKDRWAAAIFE